jgi:hypothetical protein
MHGYRVALVPYDDANEDTKAAYLAALEELRALDANPEAWECSACGETTPGGEILISYGKEIARPLPYCPQGLKDGKPCFGYGPELTPAEA